MGLGRNQNRMDIIQETVVDNSPQFCLPNPNGHLVQEYAKQAENNTAYNGIIRREEKPPGKDIYLCDVLFPEEIYLHLDPTNRNYIQNL